MRFERHVGPRVTAALDRRFTPRERGAVDGIVGQHSIPRVLPAVKARRYAPAASRLSALTPGPRARRTGNCPTMPHFDPALSRPETRLSRWGSARGSVAGMAQHVDHDPNRPRLPDRPHRPHRRVRREHEIAGGDQAHGRSSGKTSSGAGEHEESLESDDEEPGGGEKMDSSPQYLAALHHSPDLSCSLLPGGPLRGAPGNDDGGHRGSRDSFAHDGGDRKQEHSARTRPASSHPCPRSSIPSARPQTSGDTGPRVSSIPCRVPRARLLLAPALRLPVRDDTEHAPGILEGQVQCEYRAGPTKPPRPAPGGLASRDRLGMRPAQAGRG